MTCSTWADHDGQGRDDAGVADLVGQALFAAAGKDDLTDNFGVEGRLGAKLGSPTVPPPMLRSLRPWRTNGDGFLLTH